jgi:hypothetical protein
LDILEAGLAAADPYVNTCPDQTAWR